MPNLHSHAFQRAMAGSAEVAAGAEGSFWGWREVMYRFVDRLAPEDVEAITAFAHAEMLESGYTSVAEFHYLHHQRDGRPYADRATLAGAVRAAARTSGIRQLLLPCLYQQGHFDRRPLAAAQRRFHHATDDFLALVEGLARGDGARERTGIALHSLRAVPPEALAEVAAAARGAGRAVHVHVAEQAREVEDCQVAYQRRPVEYLLDGGHVDARWCLVHATHVTSEELRGIAAAGAVVGLCPTTEANLGDGRFPLDEFLGAGGYFGIGSDSHVSIDPREELRTAESLWHDAVAGGARALGFAAAGIVAGAPGDLIRLDTTRAEFAGLAPSALVDAWLFAPRPGALADVWVGGEAVVADGRHRDRDALALAYRRSLARLVPEALA
jgi:formimidoylglutamate deiminase